MKIFTIFFYQDRSTSFMFVSDSVGEVEPLLSDWLSSSLNCMLSSMALINREADSGWLSFGITALLTPKCQSRAVTCEHVPTSRASAEQVQYHALIGCCFWRSNCMAVVWLLLFEWREQNRARTKSSYSWQTSIVNSVPSSFVGDDLISSII